MEDTCACGFDARERRIHRQILALETGGLQAVVELFDELDAGCDELIDLPRMVAQHKWVQPALVYRLAEHVAFSAEERRRIAQLHTACDAISIILQKS